MLNTTLHADIYLVAQNTSGLCSPTQKILFPTSTCMLVHV